MKRSIFGVLVAVAALLLASCGSDRAYDYEYYGLNTPVKSVLVTTYEAESKFGDVVKGDLAHNGHYLATFNGVGNLESIASYDDDGDLTSLERFKYNREDRLIELSSFDDDGDIDYQLTYSYEGDQMVAECQKNYWGDTEEVTQYSHTWRGEQLLETSVTSGGTLVAKIKYSRCDKSGSEWVTYNGDGEEVARGSEELEDNRIVKRTVDGQSLEVRWNSKKLPVYLRNAHLHNNTMVSWYNNDDECVYYVEYEYDDEGNWIKQIVYEGEIKRPVTISERVITY